MTYELFWGQADQRAPNICQHCAALAVSFTVRKYVVFKCLCKIYSLKNFLNRLAPKNDPGCSYFLILYQDKVDSTLF